MSGQDRARSVSYAKIAHCYEAVRGGAVRADALAAAIEPWLPAGVVCDVGAGTGVVTERFARPDRSIIGLDLSIEMIRQASPRLPGRVAAAESSALPIATGSLDAITFVWVLHHVGDLAATLTEARRVLRPTGRLVAVSGRARPVGDDMGPIFERMIDTLRPAARVENSALRDAVDAAGFSWRHDGTARATAETSPDELAASIEGRLFSPLWDLPDEEWARVVDPALDALRSLPRRDEPRHRTFEHPMLVLDRD